MFKTKYIYIISGQSSLVACYLCTPTSTVFTCIHNSAQSMGYLVLSHRIALGRRAEFLDSAVHHFANVFEPQVLLDPHPSMCADAKFHWERHIT